MDNVRILKGYSKAEQRELEEAKDNNYSSAMILIHGIGEEYSDCQALSEKYYHEDTNEDNQMARDIADYYAGVAKFPDKKEELNSKPVMPRVFDEVFDDWCKDITAESSDIQGIVAYFKFTIDGKYNNFGPEKALFDWVHSGEYSKVLEMNLIDKTRYKKCLDAIRYGYEVEE